MIGDLRPQYFDRLAEFIDFDTADRFDMQPFSALASMLRDPIFTDRRSALKGPIGGAPQLLKIYPFLRTMEFGVFWPNRESGALHINGRETFEYERLPLPQIDGSTLDVYYPLAELTNADAW